MIKIKKSIIFITLITASYLIYKKINTPYEDYKNIAECKNKILKLGYEIKDSYCINLSEKNYLEYIFEDYNNKNYKVIYNKDLKEIDLIKEV